MNNFLTIYLVGIVLCLSTFYIGARFVITPNDLKVTRKDVAYAILYSLVPYFNLGISGLAVATYLIFKAVTWLDSRTSGGMDQWWNQEVTFLKKKRNST
jgi:hypothetical protein